ncbi:AP-1 accessory protein Laa1p [Trichomonascus vanleenenianus]|uniref:AP-1 complex accessory protein LAA1 n=1 Tax=Trichomonascus vanleenenianus TaxID=2268995 RepID=UPI003ECA37AD
MVEVLEVKFDANDYVNLPKDKLSSAFFSWISELARSVRSSDELDEATALHVLAQLKKMLEYFEASKDSTYISKPIRSQIGLVYRLVHASFTRDLYDSANRFITLLNAGRSDKYSELKHLAITVIEQLNDYCGSNLVSLAPITAITCMKHFKNSSHIGYKYTILRTLAAILRASGDALDDSLTKDLWKLAKGLTDDKSAKIAATSYAVLEALVQSKIVFKSSSDFEAFKSSYMKALNSQYPIVRQAAAKCYARGVVELSRLYVTKSEVQQMEQLQQQQKKKAKQGKKDDQNDDDDDGIADSRGGSPAPTLSRAKSIKKNYVLSFSDSLRLLVSHYLTNGASARVRVGVVETLAEVIMLCDSQFIETNYTEIATELLNKLAGGLSVRQHQYKLHAARSHVIFLLNDVIANQILGEYGQITAFKVLCAEILKNYPVVLKGQVEPAPEVIASTCQVISGLIKRLGSAVTSDGASDTLRTQLVSLLEHPDHSVQVNACLCLKHLAQAAPSLIIPILSLALNHLSKELPNLSNRKSASFSDVVGNAYLAAVLVSLSGEKPQYCSVDLTSRALTTATSLLKNNNGTAAVLATQTRVAWVLISGLMTLGPNFVKVHLSQLLLLWKNALYKPGKDQSPASKSAIEISYHLHVRSAALGSIVAFLAYNSKLITADVARRIGVMLQNTSTFISDIPAKRFSDDDIQQRLYSTVSLQDFEVMTRRRVFQCYLHLFQYKHWVESFPANLLTSAVITFADPENKSLHTKLSTAIATGAGAIDSIWEVYDNYAFGLTSRVDGYEFRNSSKIIDIDDEGHWLSERATWQESLHLERQLNSPIIASSEFDVESAFFFEEGPTVSPDVAVVDLSIDLFTVLLPSQTPKVQESMMDQLRSYLLSSLKATNEVGRKNAVVVNIAAAIFSTLQFVVARASGSQRDAMKNPRVLSIFIDIIKLLLVNKDPHVRYLAAQSMGMACSLGGSSATADHIKFLIDNIVSNRDPNARGGYSMALGYILQYVGGMFAGLHLKTILGILVSLANDPHPTVHFWALDAISITIANSGMSFSSYVNSTLATLLKLMTLDSHNDEMASIASSNLDTEYPAIRIMCRCIRSLINVMGPDLKEHSKSNSTIQDLVQFFEFSSDARIVADAHRCIQELILFAPETVDFKAFATEIRKNMLVKFDISLRDAAVEGLYQLIRTQSASKVFGFSGGELETGIWLAYNDTPENRELKKFIENWLDDTAVKEPLVWIGRIQTILIKPRRQFDPNDSSRAAHGQASLPAQDNADLMGDEEGASFNADGDGDASDGNSANEPLKWQTRALALELIRSLFLKLLSNQPKHVKSQSPLTARVGDLIKIAFSASTATVVELRLLGLKFLNDILTELKELEDPDFEEVALLEQYQAQIGSALTPAFNADSTPELAFQAVKVSATFIGSGIIKDVDRMGRILKLLTSALESCSGAQVVNLGDLKTLSTNSQVMLRIAVLSMWAELQVASVNPNQEYLIDVVQPHIETLLPLWINSLRDFAKLRFEPEQSSGLGDAGALSGSLDRMYSAMSRTSLLPIYQESWLQLVDAIASLIEKDKSMVFDILDEKERAATAAKSAEEGIKYSNEPAAFFFVLFGLCFEALVRPQNTSDSRLKVLLAMKRIMHPAVSGTVIYEDSVFAETVDLLDRIILTGDAKEQLVVISIASQLCLNHPEKSSCSEGALSESVEHLFELFRVVMLCLTNIFPFLANSDRPTPIAETADRDYLVLIKTCLDSLVSMIEVFPNIIKVDLYSCLLYVFGRFLEDEDESCQKTVVPHTLVVQRKLLMSMMQTRKTCTESASIIELAITTSVHHIVDMLKRSGVATEMEMTKRKNCLLSSVILLTTSSSAIEINEDLISSISKVLIETLTVPELADVSAECIKGLLIQTGHLPLGKHLGERILPSLISLAANSTRPSADAVNKVPKLTSDILVAFTKTFMPGSDQVSAAMALSIPVLIQFIGDKESGVPPDQRLGYAKARLMELIQFDNSSFKKVLQQGLSEWQRTLLEKVLRGDGASSVGAVASEASEGDQKTHIQLKSFV